MTEFFWYLFHNEFTYALLGVLIGAGVAWLYSVLQFRKEQQAFHGGELRHEVVVVATTLEPRADGFYMLKPRTVQAAHSLTRSFPNKVLADAIIKATQKSVSENVEDSFVVLADATTHKVFMKHVVDIASELGAAGHVLRMCNQPVINNDCYVCATFAADGFHKKIRLDLISEESLRRFLEPGFAAQIQQREDEGSHADLISLFEICAQKVFMGDVQDSRAYVSRVSIPIAGIV